jgi:lysophospholipase L1-like esterase
MNSFLRGARAALTVAVLAVPAVLGAGNASAAPRQLVDYDALGDSYASGYGVGPYGPCGRSSSAYAVQVDGREKIALDDFVACAGATTQTLVPQLGALDVDTDLVTLSIGGNDVGWGQAVAACLGSTDANCATAIARSRTLVTTALPARLDAVYSQIAAAAPNAQVLVTGYPRLFSPQYGDFLHATVAEQEQLNAGADLLDSVMAQAAAAHGFEFVDVTKRFLDHGVNAPEAWINGPLDPAPFHPNPDGYQSYTAAVTATFKPALLR